MSPLYIALICIGAVAVIAFVCWFIWFSNNKLTFSNYSVKSSKPIENTLKIVHLSDLHAKQFGKNNKKLLKVISAQHPNFIAFTGDIIHKYRAKDIKSAINFVEQASLIAPFYYVAGNHEMRNKHYADLKKSLENAGAIVLDNQSVFTHGITVVGLNCAYLKNNKIFEVTPQDNSFKMLLAHEPQYETTYARAGYDLVLCGHAHGGQWRIPFTNIGIFSPGQGLFPKLISGIHSCGETQIVISRGLGNSECPIRLFNRPEVVVITLS
jgi:hypothetical protein